MTSTPVLARVGKPHGLRGEVTVQAHTERPEQRFVSGARFDTEPAEVGPLTIATVRLHQGVYLIGFEGVADRTGAEALRGTRLLAGDDPGIGDTDEADGAEGWYEHELLGLPVVLADGTVLGEVSALHTRDVQDLLGVRLVNGHQALVPFVEQIVTQVVLPEHGDRGQVVLDPPAGLLDLEAPGD